MDPEVFLAVDDLELVGRGLAESVWHGRHGSRRSGSGTEFHRHRGYLAGDDLRRVNWALYARHRRLYTKESRLESRRPLHVMVDATGSMATAHGRWTKLHYAVRIAAGLSWLAEGQGDPVALALVREGLEGVVEPGSGQRHFAGICAALASAEPEGTGDLTVVAEQIPVFCKQPGFVVVLSDFFENENRWLAELAGLKARGHDVMALQILDPAEVELPEKGDFEFLDLESGSRLKTSAEALRTEHREVVAGWRAGLRSEAHARGIRWTGATTDEPMVPLLREWLDRR